MVLNVSLGKFENGYGLGPRKIGGLWNSMFYFHWCEIMKPLWFHDFTSWFALFSSPNNSEII